MRKKWKIIFGSVLAAIVITLILLSQLKGLTAKVLEIQPRSIAKSFTEEGKVVSSLEIPVYTLYGGRVDQLLVQEGEKVQKGQMLAVLETNELNYQLQQLKGELKSVEGEQELKTAQIALDKMKSLYEAGAISLKEYEDARSTVNAEYYPGRIEALLAQINLIEYQINEGSITAPEDGVVAGLEIKRSELAQAGQQLLMLLKEDDYRIEVYLLTEDADRIEPGMKVELIKDTNEQKINFTGMVKRIAPAAEERISALGLIEQRLKIVVRPENKPEQLVLRPGYVLDVRIQTAQQDNRLVVPKTALFPFREGEALWVVRNSKSEIQPIKKGFENEREVAIDSGLQTGDLVLLDPQLNGLKPGKRIIAEQAAAGDN